MGRFDGACEYSWGSRHYLRRAYQWRLSVQQHPLLFKRDNFKRHTLKRDRHKRHPTTAGYTAATASSSHRHGQPHNHNHCCVRRAWCFGSFRVVTVLLLSSQETEEFHQSGYGASHIFATTASGRAARAWSLGHRYLCTEHHWRNVHRPTRRWMEAFILKGPII